MSYSELNSLSATSVSQTFHIFNPKHLSWHHLEVYYTKKRSSYSRRWRRFTMKHLCATLNVVTITVDIDTSRSYNALSCFHYKTVRLTCHNITLYIHCLTYSTSLYAFFWVIPLRLNFVCRRFGTLCCFSVIKHAVIVRYDGVDKCVQIILLWFWNNN
jgi:hypothetical protein